jgi:uncharacterized membrane protein
MIIPEVVWYAVGAATLVFVFGSLLIGASQVWTFAGLAAVMVWYAIERCTEHRPRPWRAADESVFK